MPLPTVSTNINNVSMDYFLRGVSSIAERLGGKKFRKFHSGGSSHVPD